MSSTRSLAGLTAAVTTVLVLVVSAPAYAGPTVVPEPPPTDNGQWTAVIAFLVLAVVVGGMLFIANAYRKGPRE